jgi:hypothetical protein
MLSVGETRRMVEGRWWLSSSRIRFGTPTVDAGEGQRISSTGSVSTSMSEVAPGKTMLGVGLFSLVESVRDAVLRIELAMERRDPAPRSEPYFPCLSPSRLAPFAALFQLLVSSLSSSSMRLASPLSITSHDPRRAKEMVEARLFFRRLKAGACGGSRSSLIGGMAVEGALAGDLEGLSGGF